MTSAATDADTKKHFRENSYFGLKPSQLVFFQQASQPRKAARPTQLLVWHARLCSRQCWGFRNRALLEKD